MSLPRIDVLVPTCNRPAALAVTLTALGAQDYPDLRIVVSDQTEGTRTSMRGRLIQLPACAAPPAARPYR